MLAELQQIAQNIVMDDDSFDAFVRFRLFKRQKMVFQKTAKSRGMDLSTWVRTSLLDLVEAKYKADGKPSPFVDDDEGMRDATDPGGIAKKHPGKKTL